MMSLPSAHLARLALPSALELPDGEGLVLVTGSAQGRIRVIDPREGQRWIDLAELQQTAKVPCCHF